MEKLFVFKTLVALYALFFVFVISHAAGAETASKGFVLSHPPGFYTKPFELDISFKGSNQATIYFTLDGSKPSEQSRVFSAPLRMVNRTLEPNTISEIPTTFQDSPDLTKSERIILNKKGWLAPVGQVFKATVVRAVAIGEDRIPLAYFTGSYFISEQGKNRYSLPVVSLSTESSYLFDRRDGIYRHRNSLLRGRASERPTYVEFFEASGELVLSQPAGIRINGGGGRWASQKSLRLRARKDYGARSFTHGLFPRSKIRSFSQLVLRHGGYDYHPIFHRDDLADMLVEPTTLESRNIRHVIVFINGEYWGIHTLKDRLEARTLAKRYGMRAEEISISFGKSQHKREPLEEFVTLVDYATNNPLSDAHHYSFVEAKLDIDDFVEYMLAQIYLANRDWPRNNWGAFKFPVQAGAKPPFDGRWRWLFFDLDHGFPPHGRGSGDSSILKRATSQSYIGRLFGALMENEAFRNKFLLRTAESLHTIYSSERVSLLVDELSQTLSDEMLEHVNRWRYPSAMRRFTDRLLEIPSLEGWNKSISNLKKFANNRPDHLRQSLIKVFDLKGLVTITIDMTMMRESAIRLGTLTIAPPTNEKDATIWKGTYFKDVPITLEVAEGENSAFIEWGSPLLKNETKIEMRPLNDLHLRPVFR
jgi:hypothetical protein